MPGSMLRAALTMWLVATGAATAQRVRSRRVRHRNPPRPNPPFSGPVSVAGATGYASRAYFEAVNKAGGINGRQIRLLSLDDGYSPPKTVEATRRLIEDENVLMIYGSVGTPTNAAVEKYLNMKKVPQLFITTGASRFRDPKNFPWTIAYRPDTCRKAGPWRATCWPPSPAPKIAVLYQNDDLGKDFRAGFRSGLGEKAGYADRQRANLRGHRPDVDSQMVAAKASGANVFYFAGTQKAGAEQIRVRHNLGWSPLHLVCSISSNVEGGVEARRAR